MPRSTPVTHVDLYEEIVADIDDLEEDPDNVRLENQPQTVEGLSRALEYFGRYDVAPRVWRTEDGKLRALAGSGRVRAAKKARLRNRDLHAIPVIRTAPPKDRADKIFQQFSENALRDPLGPVDFGRGFKMLADEGLSYTQILAELSQRGILPKSRTKAWVSQMIQLAELDPDVQVLVNRGTISIWQGLQLRQLPIDEQKPAAERVARDNMSRADVRLLVDGGSVEALHQETRDLIQEQAAALLAPTATSGRRSERDPERRNSAVERSWSLPPAIPQSPLPKSKVAALERLQWYQTAASQEERELAVEAVSGGHSPAAAVELVRRAVEEASRTSQPLRDLLIALRQFQQQAADLTRERSTAPAEFARLRLAALLRALQPQR